MWYAIVGLLMWYGFAGYFCYLRFIDRDSNPQPDRYLVLLAWLVSPTALLLKLAEAPLMAVADVMEMATSPQRSPASFAPKKVEEETND